MQKTVICLLLTLSLLLSLGGCGSSGPAPLPEVISGSGSFEFSSSASDSDPFNPADSGDGPGPASGSGSSSDRTPAENPSSASGSPSSSQPPASSSGSGSISTSQSPSSSQPPSSQSPSSQSPSSSSQPQTPAKTVRPANEVRAVWLSYLDLGPMLTNKTEGQFRTAVRTAFTQMVDLGLNTVYAQVRPFSDALYPSQYFPQSYLFTGQEGPVGSAPFDALQIMVEEAHRLDLAIEAWLNPYRIRATGTLGNKPIHESHPANDFMDSGSDVVIEYDRGLFYNPGSPEARQMIVDGVREIVDHYDVDGIHFDDYFYPPDADASFDRVTYNSAGTTKNLGDWRREQVNLLVKQVYNAVGTGRVFGISPAGNNQNNRNMLYCDVNYWVQNPGYVDYICPQVYFGFNNATCPYNDTVRLFNNMISAGGVQLYVGLASYKIGDSQQGGEWTGSPTMMQRQVEFARTQSRYGGFALYRYDSIVSSSSMVRQEMQNLQSIY